MTDQTEEFGADLERYVLNKVRHYFVAQSKKDWEREKLSFHLHHLPESDLTDEDHNSTVDTVMGPTVDDYVESALVSLLERTPRSARYAREDLDALWRPYTRSHYTRQMGITPKGAQTIVEAIKDVLLEGELTFPIRVDAEDKWYELRRDNKELEVRRV